MPKAKRGATDLNGVIAVDKPRGMTSHDVVDVIRRLTGEGRVGHAGTLDPMATGLLLVCIGPAARLSDQLMSCNKVYEARIVFGSATDTDDAEGTVIASAPLPPDLCEMWFARQMLDAFTGELQQVPPQYSAIKTGGRKAYETARKGESTDLKPRPVTIHSLEIIEARDSHWDIRAHVSKGAYIRALARDIGEAMGSKAHLAALRRIGCGEITIEQAHTLEELQSGDIRSFFLDLGHLPRPPLSHLPRPPLSTQLSLRKDRVMPSDKQAAIISLDSNPILGEFVCAIGVFDGLHEGHRYIIDQTIAQARLLEVPAVAITFDRDPDELFKKPEDLRKVLTNEDRIGFLATSGVDVVLVITFEHELSKLAPEDFLNVVIAAHGSPRGIHVGSDFRFGHKAAGTTEDLRRWAACHDCEIIPHDLLVSEGTSVTSTRIRNALQQGDLTLANRLLMRPHYLWASVVKGRLVGRSLGFPTANLEPEEHLVCPADGVYAGAVVIDGRLYRAATSVGVPSTFDVTKATIEAHILDFEGDLYGMRLKVFFFERLRPMITFETVDELKATVLRNIEQARDYPLPELRLI